MHITIERAAPADAGTLVALQIAAFHDDARIYPGVEIGGPPGYDSVDVMLDKIREDETYKIVVDGQIVGGIVVFAKGDAHYHLDVIFIDPAHHNRGIGTRAMRLLESAYPDATLWTLDTPEYAVRNQHFYEKFGYIKVGQNVEPDGLVLYAYEKRHASP